MYFKHVFKLYIFVENIMIGKTKSQNLACTPGLATTSGGNGMYSALEYMLLGVRGLMWPEADNTSPLLRAPGRV
jgi:hypothetical protein